MTQRTGRIPKWYDSLEIMSYVDIPMTDFFSKTSFEEFLEILECFIDELKKFEIEKPYVTAIRFYGDDSPLVRSKWIGEKIEEAIGYAKVDLGIRFDTEEGIFYPSGDKELDEKLVKEPLRDLDTLGREEVSKVWKRGLRALLKSQGDHDELKDVVRDAYEALEAFAKIVCNNDRDLSGNRDRFISALNLNPYYQKMLKEYINYANEFRHAEKQQKPRPDLDYSEVEAFVYLTGLFIRLGIEKLRNHSP